MITNYKNKRGPKKRFGKFITLNVKERMYSDLLKAAEESDSDECMSDIARLGIKKELERRSK